MDAAEYKHLVLGLIFLKFISDTFQAKRAELSARFADPADEYFLPDALSLIEAENAKLKGILDKRFARAQLPDGKLGELVDLVSTIGFGSSASEARDVLGQVYEYFLGMFASA